MAVALVPDQAIFDNISLVRIAARFMHKMVSTVWTACYADGLPNLSLPLQRASFGSCS